MFRPFFTNTFRETMLLKIKIEELKKAYRPYSWCWGSWIKSDKCLLTVNEIAIINGLRMSNFNLKETGKISNETANIIEILPAKLKFQYDKFFDWLNEKEDNLTEIKQEKSKTKKHENKKTTLNS